MTNKIFKSTIALILVASLLSICVYANDILFADEFIIEETYVAEDGTVMPMANCGNHVWYVYRTGSAGHLLRCSNAGCGGALSENHYNNIFCGYYPGENYVGCQVCGEGSFEKHNHVPTHRLLDSDYTHVNICTNIEENGFGACNDIDSVESCTITRIIWKGYISGQGHTVADVCGECNYSYTVGYYTPVGHANGYDSSCVYCNISGNYTPYP